MFRNKSVMHAKGCELIGRAHVVSLQFPEDHDLASTVRRRLKKDGTLRVDANVNIVSEFRTVMKYVLKTRTGVPWDADFFSDWESPPIMFTDAPDRPRYMRAWDAWNTRHGFPRRQQCDFALVSAVKLDPLYQLTDVGEAIARADEHDIRSFEHLSRRDLLALADLLEEVGVRSLQDAYIVKHSEYRRVVGHLLRSGMHVTYTSWRSDDTIDDDESFPESVYPPYGIEAMHRRLVLEGNAAGRDCSLEDLRTYVRGHMLPIWKMTWREIGRLRKIDGKLMNRRRLDFSEMLRLFFWDETLYPEPRESPEVRFWEIK